MTYPGSAEPAKDFTHPTLSAAHVVLEKNPKQEIRMMTIFSTMNTATKETSHRFYPFPYTRPVVELVTAPKDKRHKAGKAPKLELDSVSLWDRIFPYDMKDDDL